MPGSRPAGPCSRSTRSRPWPGKKTCGPGGEREDMTDAAIEAAREAGGRVPAEPVARGWGGRSGYFADPEGNAWEVAWAPGSTFDERGGLIVPW